MLPSTNRPGGVRRLSMATVAFAVVAGSLALGASVVPAQEAPEAEARIEIERTSPSPQPSGSTFTYDVDVSCDLLGDGGGSEALACEGPVITLPLGPELTALIDAGLMDLGDFALDPPGVVESAEIVDGTLVVHTLDIPVGSSIKVQFSVTPPNFVTPDGTQWTFDPTISGDNFEPSTAPDPADGVATASLSDTINKSVDGNAFRERGEEFTYDIVVACNQQATGTILADSMEVTDSLPEGVTYVSSDPLASGAPDGPLVWTLTGDDLPTSCTEPGASGSTTLQITVRVDDDAVYGTEITNTAGVTATTTDGQEVPEKDDSAAITVIDDDDPNGPGGIGSFRKDSFAQLRDEDAAPSGSTAGLESQSHTTYPGNWLGVLADQSGNPLSGYVPNQATGMRQAGYKMEYRAPLDQGSGFQHDLIDPVPCLSNKTAQVYDSNAVGDLCADPAFIVSTVSVWSSASGGTPAITTGWTPTVLYSDGTSAAMEPSPGPSANHANFRVPASPKVISEVAFPRDGGLAGPVVRWALYGYVDPSVQNGEIVKNTASDTVYWLDQQTPRATLTNDADLYVVDGPQTGIEKDLGSRNAEGTDQTSLELTYRLTLAGAATEDLVVTDLLPVGMTTVAPVPAATATVGHLDVDGTSIATTDVAGTTEVIDNYQGSGRQLVRLTFSVADLAPLGSLRLEGSGTYTVSYVPEPGTYLNTSQIYYTNDSLLPTCQQSPAYTQQSDEQIDLNENGSTADNHCYSQDSLTIPAPSGPAAFQTTKTVQGDTDQAPHAYPAIGTVTEAGGSVTFTLGWKNVGGVPLTGAVIYDIFPTPGDVGVGGTVAGQPRNSDFTATIVGSGPLPTGSTIEYSASSNPCRPEVFPDAENPGCTDDWTSVLPTDTTTVTAIRIVSTETYAPGEGFTFDIYMTTPEIEPGEIAWNSIAGAATETDGSELNPNSPPKVGITGESTVLPLLLKKELDDSVDPTAVAVGDTVTYHLSISNPDLVTRTLDATDDLPDGLVLVDIVPEGDAPMDHISTTPSAITWTDQDVPSGVTYTWTVRALVTPGAVGEETNEFSSEDGTSTDAGCEDDPDAECQTIVVPPVDVTVSKAVDGDGAAFAPGTFPITITCYQSDAPGTPILEDTVDLAAGGSETFQLPQSSVCSVVEDDPGGATDTTFEIDGETYAEGEAFEVDGDDVTIAATNTFDQSYLVVNKLIDGVGAPLAQRPFTFSVACTFEGAPVPGFPQQVTLQAEPGETSLTSDPIGPLPIGASCTVTETSNGSADATPAPITVDVSPGPNDVAVEVTFTNEFSAGTVAVAKELDGDYVDTGEIDDFEFAIDVTCTYEGLDLFTRSVALQGGEATTIVDAEGDPVLLPVGTTCAAIETDANGASQPPVVSEPVTVVAGTPDDLQTMEIVVTNTFDQGGLIVEKNLIGVGAPLATGPFTIDVACTFQRSMVAGFPTQVELTRDGDETTMTSDVLGPLPVGARCLVGEVGDGGADARPRPVTVTIDADDDANTAVASIDNAYSAGTITVAKAIDGTYADIDQVTSATFDVLVTCVRTEDGVEETSVDTVVTVRGGERQVVPDAAGEPLLLPVGTTCWGEEVDAGDASSSSVAPDGPAEAVTVEAGRPDALQEMTITATNTFDVDVWGLREDRGSSPLAQTGRDLLRLVLWGAALTASGAAVLSLVRRRRPSAPGAR